MLKMVNGFKTLKDLEFQKMFINSREKQIIDFTNEELRKEVLVRTKFLKEVFLDDAPSINEERVIRLRINKKPANTPREAYFHQLGKFEELVRFFNITEEDLAC
jgi:hypothetical protein